MNSNSWKYGQGEQIHWARCNRRFRTVHQEHPQSLGFEIEIEKRKIVYSVIRLVGGPDVHSENADLFICECSFFETRLETHLDYPRIAENLEPVRREKNSPDASWAGSLEAARRGRAEMAHDGLIVPL